VPAEVYAFRGPASHTGEDVAEYHVPGGPLVSRLLLEALRERGLRDARPGEFTARAFVNGKLSLDRAEAVQLAIGAETDAELSAARRLRSGELADALAGPTEELVRLLALSEAAIDFAGEEDVVPLPPDEARRSLTALRSSLDALVATRHRRASGELPTVALVGRPNAGKSTLFNALVGDARVVASPMPGTTRDAIAAEVVIGDVRTRLVDLPGIGTFDDTLDASASDRAAALARGADVVVLVADPLDAAPAPDVDAALVVRTKSDLRDVSGGACPTGSAGPPAGQAPPLTFDVSAISGTGMSDLRRELATLVATTSTAPAFAMTDRHVACVRRAIGEVEAALAEVGGAEELVAERLRAALDALGEVTGVVTPDDVLGRIFAGFCIGK